VNWFIRKAIGMMNVTLIIRQRTDEDGTENITITQPGAAGIKGTEEKRRVPPTNDEQVWNDHKDHVFGHVKGTPERTRIPNIAFLTMIRIQPVAQTIRAE
jgi:hypothetical protein